MNKPISTSATPLPYLYIIVGILHVLFTYFDIWQGVYISKCLLMPLLIAWLWAADSHVKGRRKWYLTLGLIFSLIGDVVLMTAQANNKAQFLLGLSAFLCTHLFYILTFISEVPPQQSHNKIIQQKPTLLLPFVLYFLALLYLVKDFLWANNLLLPVSIYAAIICCMSIMALNRYGNVNTQSFKLVFVGALLFMLSDSTIAINRFYQAFALGNEIIMTTYILAQGFIIKGEIAAKS